MLEAGVVCVSLACTYLCVTVCVEVEPSLDFDSCEENMSHILFICNLIDLLPIRMKQCLLVIPRYNLRRVFLFLVNLVSVFSAFPINISRPRGFFL